MHCATGAGVSAPGYRHIKKREISPSFLRINFDEPFSVCGPDWLVKAAGTRWRTVANNESVDIKIKVGREIPWFRVWGEVEHPQVGLRV